MNSDELREITQKMADVELPPPPDWQPLVVTAVVVLTVALIAVVIIHLRSRRNISAQLPDSRREALYQLHLLQQAWQQQEIDDHETAYRLATLLRLGLELNQLTENAPPSLQDEEPQWQMVIALLTRLRYQTDEPLVQAHDNKLSAEIFTQIEQWLKRGKGLC